MAKKVGSSIAILSGPPGLSTGQIPPSWILGGGNSYRSVNGQNFSLIQGSNSRPQFVDPSGGFVVTTYEKLVAPFTAGGVVVPLSGNAIPNSISGSVWYQNGFYYATYSSNTYSVGGGLLTKSSDAVDFPWFFGNFAPTFVTYPAAPDNNLPVGYTYLGTKVLTRPYIDPNGNLWIGVAQAVNGAVTRRRLWAVSADSSYTTFSYSYIGEFNQPGVYPMAETMYYVNGFLYMLCFDWNSVTDAYLFRQNANGTWSNLGILSIPGVQGQCSMVMSGGRAIIYSLVGYSTGDGKWYVTTGGTSFTELTNLPHSTVEFPVFYNGAMYWFKDEPAVLPRVIAVSTDLDAYTDFKTTDVSVDTSTRQLAVPNQNQLSGYPFGL